MSNALRQLHDAANTLADSGLRTIKTNDLCVAVYGAIDELERLSAENARLRWALTEIIRQHERFVPDDELCDLHYQGGLEVCFDIARAALAEKEST